MRLHLVTFDFPPAVGGIQTRAANYVKNLVIMGHKVTVTHIMDPQVTKNYFGMKPKSEQLNENFCGAGVFRSPSSIKNISKTFFQTIKMLRRSGSVDVIHIVSGANTPIGLVFLLYGKLKRIKVGVSFYGKDILDSYHIYFLLQRAAMLIADRIGVNSKATLELIPRRFRGKTKILYPGVDASVVSFQKSKSKEKTILFVGRLVKRKGVDDLIVAFQQVRRKISDAKLMIVGDGPQRETLIELTRSLKIDDKVEFKGTLVGEPLWQRYQECDVFAMPSKETKRDVEGFGMVFLEAGFFKKPGIGTWTGGIPEAVIHNKTGLLVPQGNVNALSEAIALLLSNENLAKKLGENAYNRVISKFSWQKATSEFLKMYQDES